MSGHFQDNSAPEGALPTLPPNAAMADDAVDPLAPRVAGLVRFSGLLVMAKI
jgi:hypothetical protein